MREVHVNVYRSQNVIRVILDPVNGRGMGIDMPLDPDFITSPENTDYDLETIALNVREAVKKMPGWNCNFLVKALWVPETEAAA